jgi:hypothetical protein
MSSRSGSTPAPSIRSTPASRRPIAANIPGHGRVQTPRTQTPRATPPVETKPGSVTPEPHSQFHGQIQQQRAPYSPYEASAATYPRFLPLWETARLQIGFFTRGLLDANRWDRVLKIVIEWVAQPCSISLVLMSFVETPRFVRMVCTLVIDT